MLQTIYHQKLGINKCNLYVGESFHVCYAMGLMPRKHMYNQAEHYLFTVCPPQPKARHGSQKFYFEGWHNLFHHWCGHMTKIKLLWLCFVYKFNNIWRVYMIPWFQLSCFAHAIVMPFFFFFGEIPAQTFLFIHRARKKNVFIKFAKHFFLSLPPSLTISLLISQKKHKHTHTHTEHFDIGCAVVLVANQC